MSDIKPFIEELGNQFTEFKSQYNDRATAIEKTVDDLVVRRVGAEMGGYDKANSPGAKFAQAFDDNRELFAKTKSMSFDIKAAATDVVTTDSGRRIISGGVGAVGGSVIGLQNALTVQQAPGTSAIEYARFLGVQGAAAVQSAEGTQKAAVRPDHLLVTQAAMTIAGYCKMSRQALTDSGELKRAIDTTLRRSVSQALDVALTNGATGFVGGFASLATPSTSLVYSNLVDVISEGVAQMQTDGFAPGVVVVTPADWLSIMVARGVANDHYLSGNYLNSLPSEMRGLHVALSPSVASGKALLLDASHCELQVVDNFSVSLGFENSDFTKNILTILAELRVLPVFRSVGAMRLLTPKA